MKEFEINRNTTKKLKPSNNVISSIYKKHFLGLQVFVIYSLHIKCPILYFPLLSSFCYVTYYRIWNATCNSFNKRQTIWIWIQIWHFVIHPYIEAASSIPKFYILILAASDWNRPYTFNDGVAFWCQTRCVQRNLGNTELWTTTRLTV